MNTDNDHGALEAIAAERTRQGAGHHADQPVAASFAVPDGALGAATFGRITSTANNIPRQFQFAAKYLF